MKIDFGGDIGRPVTVMHQEGTDIMSFGFTMGSEMPMPELDLLPEEQDCKKANFDPTKYESGVAYTTNFDKTMKQLGGDYTTATIILAAMDKIRERVESGHGACYHQVARYKNVEFHIIDDGTTIAFLMPEDR